MLLLECGPLPDEIPAFRNEMTKDIVHELRVQCTNYEAC